MRIALLVLAVMAFFPGATAAQNALPWFHTYTIPGDYAVGGVDLVPLSFANGLRTRKILMGNQVPPNAEILAAFLYWETMYRGPETVGDQLARQVRFRGEPVTAIKSTRQALTPGCRAVGNGEWIAMMRADVLRLLPMQLDETGKPTGRRLVNDSDLAMNGLDLHTVTLPDSGIFNFVPQSAGASLLVVYQNPDPTAPLTSVVMYDGLHVQAPGADTELTIRGLVDAVNGSAAKLTYIGGSGFANLTDRVFVGTRRVDNGNPFPAGGLLTDRGWSNPTFNLAPGTWTPQDDANYGEQVTTRVTHALPLLLYDCLSMGAVVFSTRTQDSDGDGLPDKLEAVSGLKNPHGIAYPDIHAMGADPNRRDLFVEVNAMWAPGGTSYGVTKEPFVGVNVDADGHRHMPTPAVLKQVGDALAHPPAGQESKAIAVHFDVGPPSVYHALPDPDVPEGTASRYLSTEAEAYIIDEPYARGGEEILEQHSSRFPAFPGTVSWNSAYQILASAPVGSNGEELAADAIETLCGENGDAAPCRRRFDLNRHGIFHLGMYVHARGLPKSMAPCVLENGEEAVGQTEGNCSVGANPAYYVPKSVSGVAELPGKFFMVSLGLWDNFRGTDNMQANTTLHELGHNLDLWHGGGKPQFTPGSGGVRVFVQPNCKPNHLSVMSYLFQATGVRGFDGVARARFSGEVVGSIDEQGLMDGPLGLSVDAPYTSWYAPKVEGTRGFELDLETATKHCDGTPLLPATDPAVGMVRLDALTPNESIDWTGAEGPAQYEGGQDVNFDGKKDGDLVGYSDWDGIALNRLGSGFNIAGLSQGLDFGGLDFGGLDFGGLDFGGLDFGGLDFGGLDFGGLDFGGLDFGGLDFGGLDFGGLDFGGLDFGGLDFGGLADEATTDVTYEDVLEAIAPGGSTPPNNLTACVIGVGDCTGDPEALHRHKLDWEEPTVGSPDFYRVARAFSSNVFATEPADDDPVTFVGATPDGATTAFLDDEELPDGKRFIYFVQGAKVDGTDGPKFGNPSNFAAVTAVNSPPVAANDSVSLLEDSSVTFASVLGNDKDEDSDATSLKAAIVTGPMHGTLLFNADGTFTYAPEPDFFGTDSFTYYANNGVWSQDSSVLMSANSNIATVTIEVRPVNDEPTFTKGPDQVINQNAGPQTVVGWATNILPRPSSEGDQLLDFIVTNNNPTLFETQPLISPEGTLTYTPKATASGVATVTVVLHDNGGTNEGGDDTSAPQTFTVTVNAVALAVMQAEKTAIWFTSSSSGTMFDLKAEVMKNGTVIARGALTNTTLGFGTTFAEALYKQISMSRELVPFSNTDTMRLRVSIRLSNVSGAPSSAETKLYYNVATLPGKSSHLKSKRNSINFRYFMIKSPSGLLELQKEGTLAGLTQFIDFTVTSKTTYQEIATFSVTGP